jgi:MFS family permease
VLIAARVIQGVSGGMIPLAFGIIRDEMPPSQVPFAISVISALLAAGVAIGIVVSGVVVDAFGYHWLFVIPGIVAAVLVVVVRLGVPESVPGERRAVKVMPALLLAGWLVSLLIGLSKASTWGWLSLGVQSMIWAVWLFWCCGSWWSGTAPNR